MSREMLTVMIKNMNMYAIANLIIQDMYAGINKCLSRRLAIITRTRETMAAKEVISGIIQVVAIGALMVGSHTYCRRIIMIIREPLLWMLE